MIMKLLRTLWVTVGVFILTVGSSQAQGYVFDDAVLITSVATGPELHIQKSTVPTIRLDNQDTAISVGEFAGTVEFFSADVSAGVVVGSISSVTLDAGTRFGLSFNTRTTSGASTERARIDDVGNFGIGTTSPNQSLDVERAGGNVARFLSTATDTAVDVLIVDQDNSATRAALQVQGNAGAIEVLFAASNGNVGIGDTSPDAPLDVVGDVIISTELTVGAGTAGDPSVNFGTSITTGMYLGSTVGDDQIAFSLSGTARASIGKTGSSVIFNLIEGAFGTGNIGGAILAGGRNTSGSGAAGVLLLDQLDGVASAVWVDDAQLLRISGAAPEEDGTPSDTSGTVVGDQSSSLDSKVMLGEFTDYGVGLQAILDAPLHAFRYRSGAYNSESFIGVVTDYSPIFGKDRDAEHPGGKSLNETTAFGMTFAAIRELERRLSEVEAVIR